MPPALACLLILQSLVSGLAVTGHAETGGGSTAAICTPDGIQPISDPARPPAEPHDMSCCVIGCGGSGAGTAAPPSSAELPIFAGFAQRPVPLPADRFGGGQWHSPLGPRAPPRTA